VVQQQMQLNAPLVRRNLAQSNIWRRDRSPWHPSSAGILESELALLLVPGWLAAKPWHLSAVAQRSFAAAPKADVRWHRPAWSEQEPLANPGAEVSLHSRQASADFTQRLGVPN